MSSTTTSGKRSPAGRLSYHAFVARFGMPDRQGIDGVVFRFVGPEVIADLETGECGPFTEITEPTTIRYWRDMLAKAAERCERHDKKRPKCGCAKEASRYTFHAGDRTRLIAQPVS